MKISSSPRLCLSVLLLSAATVAIAQEAVEIKPEDSEVWAPMPPVVTPAPAPSQAPPSDAIRLFDGSSLDEWVAAGSNEPAGWDVVDGLMVVDKSAGNIETKRRFTNYQLHLEWRVPAGTTETGQSRGNSGVFLASTGPGDAGYEIQILDSHENETYVNGQAGSIYKQYAPLANAMRPQGEWQSYDIVWTAPTFNPDGSLKSPAYVTAFHNGVLVQDNVQVLGETVYIGKPAYKAHGPSPIKLQAHGDPSPPISFRNIWVRELPDAGVSPRVGILGTSRTSRPEWMQGPNWPYASYDFDAPTLPADLGRPAILIFGKTNGYRHDHIGESSKIIADRVRARGWTPFVTENAAVFNPEQLARFDAVVFNSSSGDLFTLDQRAAFRAWIEKGGGFVGLHGAGGDSAYGWRWYPDVVIGARFTGHPMNPQFRRGRITVEDRNHPATRHLKRSWSWTEEYYSFSESPRGPDTHVLATVDEKTYNPGSELAMGKDHPLVWWRCAGKARIFYSALGHQIESYRDPDHIKMIDEAIAWAARQQGEGCD